MNEYWGARWKTHAEFLVKSKLSWCFHKVFPSRNEEGQRRAHINIIFCFSLCSWVRRVVTSIFMSVASLGRPWGRPPVPQWRPCHGSGACPLPKTSFLLRPFEGVPVLSPVESAFSGHHSSLWSSRSSMTMAVVMISNLTCSDSFLLLIWSFQLKMGKPP